MSAICGIELQASLRDAGTLGVGFLAFVFEADVAGVAAVAQELGDADIVQVERVPLATAVIGLGLHIDGFRGDLLEAVKTLDRVPASGVEANRGAAKLGSDFQALVGVLHLLLPGGRVFEHEVLVDGDADRGHAVAEGVPFEPAQILLSHLDCLHICSVLICLHNED